MSPAAGRPCQLVRSLAVACGSACLISVLRPRPSMPACICRPSSARCCRAVLAITCALEHAGTTSVERKKEWWGARGGMGGRKLGKREQGGSSAKTWSGRQKGGQARHSASCTPGPTARRQHRCARPEGAVKPALRSRARRTPWEGTATLRWHRATRADWAAAALAGQPPPWAVASLGKGRAALTGPWPPP